MVPRMGSLATSSPGLVGRPEDPHIETCMGHQWTVWATKEEVAMQMYQDSFWDYVYSLLFVVILCTYQKLEMVDAVKQGAEMLKENGTQMMILCVPPQDSTEDRSD